MVRSHESSAAAMMHGFGVPKWTPGRVPRVRWAITQTWKVDLPTPPRPGVRVSSPAGMRSAQTQRTGRGLIAEAGVSRTRRAGCRCHRPVARQHLDKLPDLPAGLEVVVCVFAAEWFD